MDWGAALFRECADALSAPGIQAAESIKGLVGRGGFEAEWQTWKADRSILTVAADNSFGYACDWVIRGLLPKWDRQFLLDLELPSAKTEKDGVELRLALILPAPHPWIRITCTGGKERRRLDKRSTEHMPWMRKARPSTRKWLFQVLRERERELLCVACA